MADDKVVGTALKNTIALVCAIITTIGVFLAWKTVTVAGTAYDFTGIDIYDFGRDTGADPSTFYFAPIIALFTGIAAAVVTILPLLSVTKNSAEKYVKISNIIVLILYMATMASAYGYGGPDVFLEFDSDYFDVIGSMGIGFWLVAVFSFIGILTTLMRMSSANKE